MLRWLLQYDPSKITNVRFLSIPISQHISQETAAPRTIPHPPRPHGMIDIWLSDISRAAPATSNQRKIWDLQSLPVDTTGRASKRLFTVASGSLTGRRHRHIPADGLKTNHLGSAWTVIFSTTKEKKKKEANSRLCCRCLPTANRITGFFSLYDWCAFCLGCFRTTAGSNILLQLTSFLSDQTHWARWITKSTCQNWWRRRILWTRPSSTHCVFLIKVSPAVSCQTIRVTALKFLYAMFCAFCAITGWNLLRRWWLWWTVYLVVLLAYCNIFKHTINICICTLWQAVLTRTHFNLFSGFTINSLGTSYSCSGYLLNLLLLKHYFSIAY